MDVSSTPILATSFTVAHMNTRPQPKTSLARNLAHLMERQEHSSHKLAKMAKVSQKAISNILNEKSVAKLDTVDKLASVYGLASWHLILPNLPAELLKPDGLENLFNAYVVSSEDGREHIESVAEREAKYSQDASTQ